MKQLLEKVIVPEITSSIIYKLSADFVEDNDGPIDATLYLERIESETIPNDGNVYLIPVRLTNSLDETRFALATCSTAIQYVHEPFYIIGDDSRLINVRDTEFLSDKTYSLESLQDQVGFDDSLEEASSHLPNNVGWENFLPTDVIPGVGYVIIPGQRFQSAIDDLCDGMTEEELDRALMISTILHQVQLRELPQTIYAYYLPVRVHFNETQFKDGYAYFDDGVVDLHFFDERWGLVSVVNTPEMVENLGFFVNKEILSYEFLLPEVEPIRHRFELE